MIPTKTASLRALPKSLGVLLALCATALPALAQDTVTLKDGKAESGRVKSADYEGVVVEAKGQAKTIEWPNVASITYKDAPEDYVAGREAYEASRWDDALAAFEKLKGDSKLRSPIRQDAFYLSASCSLAKDDWNAAIAGFDALRKEFPKSRYLMEAGEGYVTAFTAKKDFAGATKALDTMANEAAVAGVPQSFSATVSLLKGKVLEDQGKVSEAAAAYGVAEKASGAALAVIQQARLGQGRCFLAQKKNSDAESIFRRLTNEDASNQVLAGAWNGLGDIWMADAMTKGEAEKADRIYEAAYAYMRGVVQYGPGPGESAREYRRALEGAMNAFKGLSQVEKNADKKRVFQQRYAERKEQYEREFGAAK